MFRDAVHDHCCKDPETGEDNHDEQSKGEGGCDFVAVQVAMDDCCEHAERWYDEEELRYPREDEEDAGDHGCWIS